MKPRPASLRPAGTPRRDLAMGGVHLPLFATFELWLKRNETKQPAAVAEWRGLADKQKFFVNIAAVCFSGSGAPSAFSYCFTQARYLTAEALPVLLKRADELNDEHLRAFCYKPPSTEKITPAQASRRQKAVKANARFLEATAKKPRRITEVNP